MSETIDINDKNELNHLYHLKVKEELQEVIDADHKDIMEFADLVQVVISWAKSNNFSYFRLFCAIMKKSWTHGFYCNSKTIPIKRNY